VNHTGGNAEITVHDIAGRTAGTVFSGELSPGEHTFMIPSDLPAGVFIVSLETENAFESVKILSL